MTIITAVVPFLLHSRLCIPYWDSSVNWFLFLTYYDGSTPHRDCNIPTHSLLPRTKNKAITYISRSEVGPCDTRGLDRFIYCDIGTTDSWPKIRSRRVGLPRGVKLGTVSAIANISTWVWTICQRCLAFTCTL